MLSELQYLDQQRAWLPHYQVCNCAAPVCRLVHDKYRSSRLHLIFGLTEMVEADTCYTNYCHRGKTYKG